MSLQSARAMLVAALEVGDGAVKSLAKRVLAELEDPIDDVSAALSPAERAKRYRERKRHGPRDDRHGSRDGSRDGPSRSVTEIVTPAVTIVTKNVTARDAGRDASVSRDLNLDLSGSESFQDFLGDLFLGGPGGSDASSVTEPVTAVTKNVTASVTVPVMKTVTAAVTRKRSKTHCPGPEESPDAIDAWCRSHRLPPASQVPEVDKMIGWHQKNGIPRASWLRTWQDWERKGRDLAAESPSGTRLVAAAEAVDERGARKRAEDAVRAAYRASPEYQADLARAHQADEEQRRRAQQASARPPSSPTPLAGHRPKPLATAAEREERERQIETLIDDEIRKAGGT